MKFSNHSSTASSGYKSVPEGSRPRSLEYKNTTAFAGFGRSGLRFLQLLRLTSLWLRLLHNKQMALLCGWTSPQTEKPALRRWTAARSSIRNQNFKKVARPAQKFTRLAIQLHDSDTFESSGPSQKHKLCPAAERTGQDGHLLQVQQVKMWHRRKT